MENEGALLKTLSCEICGREVQVDQNAISCRCKFCVQASLGIRHRLVRHPETGRYTHWEDVITGELIPKKELEDQWDRERTKKGK